MAELFAGMAERPPTRSTASRTVESAAAIARTCCAAAKFTGPTRFRNARQLEADLTALVLQLRSCILLDYGDIDYAARKPDDASRESAAARVAAALRETGAFPGAAVVTVGGTAFLFLSPEDAARPRAPEFIMADSNGTPRWATPVEAVAYRAALQSASEKLIGGGEGVGSIVVAAGLTRPTLLGWLLDYPCLHAFAVRDAPRVFSGGNGLAFQLEADGGVVGHRFAVPAALVGPTLDAALARAVSRLPTLTAPHYVQMPPDLSAVERARTCCAAAKFTGRNRRANEQQLEADVTALALSLRFCILWDYPMKDGAAAAERVAAAMRENGLFRWAAVAAVDDAPVLLPSPDHAAWPRAPAFVVLDGADAPRWAAPTEAAAYGAALQSAAEGLVDGGSDDAALAAAGLSPSSLFGWLLDYPVCYAFADGAAAARALSGGDAVVFQLEADGGVAGHRFSVPAALVGPTLDAALARALARLPESAAPRYVQQPPVAGVVAF